MPLIYALAEKIMIKDWIRFESIEIDKNGYYVTYNPVFSGDNFAFLAVSFYEPIEPQEAIFILESEFKYWVKRYPTPLMAMPSNKTKQKLDVKSLTGNEYLVGYPDNDNGQVLKWESIPENEYSHFDLSNNKLLSIYSDLTYKTNKDVEKKLQKQVKERNILMLIVLMWVSVVPALIAIFGWANPYISLLALIYSLYIAAKKGGEITGLIKKSKEDENKMEEELQKEHHHYHCKLNPEGFIRLRNENFSADEEAELQRKLNKLRN